MNQLAIVGLPNCGKSTIFHAATRAPTAISETPYSTRKLIRARVRVPGRKLAPLQLIDTPALARGAARGKGLGNKFLEKLRTCDILVHVVRLFARRSLGAPHPEGRIAPLRDIDIVETELQLADLAAIRRRLEPEEGERPSADDAARTALEEVAKAIEGGQSARQMGLPPEELADLLGMELLTAKPQIFVINVDEEDLFAESRMSLPEELFTRIRIDDAPYIVASGRLEADAAALDGREGLAMLEELGIDEPLGAKLARAAEQLLRAGR